MRNLIYQYWIGEIEPCAVHGTNAMAAYADRIGAEYIFEHDPKFISKMVTKWASHYSALRPVFDESFHVYDNVLFADCDVFPVEGLTTNIFDEPCADIGICEEIGEPAFRKNDPNFDEEGWAQEVVRMYGGDVKRTKENLPCIYNSGVVRYTKAGMVKAKENFNPMEAHQKHFSRFGKPLYCRDQSYMNAHIIANSVDWTIMDTKWNTRLHYQPNTSNQLVRPIVDKRDKNTSFVHVQLSGSGNWNAGKLHEAVNKRAYDWTWR